MVGFDLIGKTDGWLARISPYNQHKMDLNKARAALLVIDMQRAFFDPASPTFSDMMPAIIPNTRRLIERFRELLLPVIYTAHVHHPKGLDLGIMGWWWPDMPLKEGSKEVEIIDELAPQMDEKIVYKHRYSAFYNTDLEIILRSLKVEDLVITGVLTNICCESTARDAYFRDYRVFFLADATATLNEEMHLASLINLAYGFAYITRTEEILSQLI